jgi:hypothetical protein
MNKQWHMDILDRMIDNMKCSPELIESERVRWTKAIDEYTDEREMKDGKE